MTDLGSIVFSLRVLGKPAFLDPFFLVEDFLDCPKRGKSKHAQQRRQQDVLHKQGTNRPRHAQQQKDPPATGAPVILGLYHYRMEQADNEKRADANE